jgi:hypothetical protein
MIPNDLGEVWSQRSRAHPLKVGDLTYFAHINEEVELNPMLCKVLSVGVVDVQVQILATQDGIEDPPLIMIAPLWRNMGKTRVN